MRATPGAWRRARRDLQENDFGGARDEGNNRAAPLQADVTNGWDEEVQEPVMTQRQRTEWMGPMQMDEPTRHNKI